MPTRKALRLHYLDYSTAGAYFITVCTHLRRCVFGAVYDDRVLLDEAGLVVERQLMLLSARLSGVTVDAFVVMPNHIHALVQLHERARQASPLRHVVGGLKSGSTREINATRGTPGAPVWQRGYYDHVIRDEQDLEGAREYIQANPIRWALDPYHA